MIPGDVIDEAPDDRTGPGVFIRDGHLIASRLGLAEQRQGVWGVIPLNGVYQPRAGDLVVAVIKEVGPSMWLTDINGPYPAPMHASETPWKVDFGETSEFLRAGDTILAKILFVDETKKQQITMKDPSLKKLDGGTVIQIRPSKVARVIGRGGSMVQLIKDKTGTWLVVGQNGRVWLNGDADGIQVAVDTIRFIEENAHKSGLTEKVTAYLDERAKEAGLAPAQGGSEEEE